MARVKSNEENYLRFEQQCSLLNIIASCMQSLAPAEANHSDGGVNLDLFHRYQLAVNPRSAEMGIKNLFELLVNNNPDGLVWVHSVDAFHEDVRVVVFRLGHDGVVNKDTAGFRALWAQLIHLGAALDLTVLSDGREEFVLKIPASARLESESAPLSSFEADFRFFSDAS